MLFRSHLFKLWNEKKVSEADVIAKSQNPDELIARIEKAKRGIYDDDKEK